MKPKTTGAFRAIRKKGPEWEVWFKHFNSGMMILIAYSLTRQQAEKRKDNLNAEIYKESTDGKTPSKPEEEETVHRS